jgi:hypothetical protein
VTDAGITGIDPRRSATKTAISARSDNPPTIVYRKYYSV